MKLHDDWRWIVRKAWSFRLMIIAGLLSGVEVILPFFTDRLPRGIFVAMSFVVTCAALISRIVAQNQQTSIRPPPSRGRHGNTH